MAGAMTADMSRRGFLKGAVALTLALRHLRPALAAGAGAETTAALPHDYRSWEDVYRQQWRWDRIVHGTHLWANCASACSMEVYVKDGVVWREEQAPVYSQTNSDLPDFNPRGCQKGACYSELAHSPMRLKYPLKRVGPRGSGRWQRTSWDEALTEIADRIIDVCVQDGPQCITWDFGNMDFGPSAAAQMRLFMLLGVPMLDALAGTGDLPIGALQTWGLGAVDGSSDDWFRSDFIVVWSMNPTYTRIPDAHFLWEARYRGATVVSIAPDFNATSIHADLWLNPRVGTDAALAMAMAEVIVREKLYREVYIKEQTDLPFLIRDDNREFLRQRDFETGGRDDIFFVWDTKTQRPVQAPGTAGHSRASLQLGEISPALEGTYDVALNGTTVRVRPVFAVLKERLAAFTPAMAAQATGVSAAVIERVARAFAQSGAAMILASFGSCKHLHTDLLQRGMILLLALTGNQGKRGGGLRLSAMWSLSGFEWLAGAQEPAWWQKLALRFYQPSPQVIEKHLRKYVREEGPFQPMLLWLWFHGGLKERLAGDHPELAAAVKEACDRGWMPVFPAADKHPRIFFATGANALRRWPVPQVIEKHLWPKLDLVVTVDFRLSTTGIKSDIVLPAAGYYEKRGIKYAQSYVPYVVFGDKAVEPPGEARGEWQIYGMLARTIQQRARERGAGLYRDALGKERDLSKLYDRWSAGGRFPCEDDSAALGYIMENSSSVVDCSWERGVEQGAVRIQGIGMYGPGSGICSDFQAGETVYPSQWFVDKKRPWPTLTGRQQFYLDHPWFLEAGEELPCFKAPPSGGGAYPLALTGGHTRWSIHAIWRAQDSMLRLQRGEPVAYMNDSDARSRGIEDHDLAMVYNGFGKFRTRIKTSPAVQPGQLIIYHAWEPYQFENWRSSQEVIPSPFKRTHLVGDYGHISYRMYYLSPGYTPRGTAVEVVKLDDRPPKLLIPGLCVQYGSYVSSGCYAARTCGGCRFHSGV
jgi:DMSO reductase family type II enzyme molybdopterin subunit